jgi:hypothetical protein
MPGKCNSGVKPRFDRSDGGSTHPAAAGDATTVVSMAAPNKAVALFQILDIEIS